jgi:hypothetical protein
MGVIPRVSEKNPIEMLSTALNALSRVRFWVLFIGMVATIGVAGARESIDEIITKARAFVGDERALNSVQSIHFRGTLKTEKEDAAIVEVDIIVMQPDSQKITIQAGDVKEITALNHYVGWKKIEKIGNESSQFATMLNARQIRRMQANSWEALNFFRGIEKKRGRVEFLGEEEVGDRLCLKLAFIHSPSISFIRFFDIDTGCLVVTKTEAGGAIYEAGEIMVEGIRFPKKIITVVDGSSSTIEFDRITLNETFDEDFFNVPMFSSRKSP